MKRLLVSILFAAVLASCAACASCRPPALSPLVFAPKAAAPEAVSSTSPPVSSPPPASISSVPPSRAPVSDVTPPSSSPPAASLPPRPTPPPTIPSIPPTSAGLTHDQLYGILPPVAGWGASHRMFDFTELSPYFTGAGGDTIGDILQQYGTPDKLLGGLDTYGDQWVEIDYPLLTLRVTPNDSDEQRGFSFATRENSGKKASEFPITSRDKTISLAVVSVRTIDPKTTLPRGLAIGQSTRAQVTAVYPTGSGASMSGSGVNAVEFSYVWFKTADFGAVGGLVYEFDGSDILTGFTVNWFYFTP